MAFIKTFLSISTPSICRRQLLTFNNNPIITWFNLPLEVRRHSSVKIAVACQCKQFGKEMSIKGWVRSVRNMKKTIFLDVNDGSTSQMLQVVIRKSILPSNLSYGASIEVTGKLSLAPSGQTELQAENVTVIGTCAGQGYPFSQGKKYLPEETRATLHFRPRTRTSALLLRIRSRITQYVHDFFQSEGFIHIHTPIITSNSCEGAAETFKVVPKSNELIDSMKKEGNSDDESFFDRSVYLTESGQLHLEAMARSLCNVYQFGPVFRAENSKSKYHLNEFYMVEAEIAFLTNIYELNNFIEKFLKSILNTVLHELEDEINQYRQMIAMPNFDPGCILHKPFIILNYDEATQLLKTNSNKLNEPYYDTKHLTKEHEIFLIEYNGNIPIFLINWPKEKKPFYVKTFNNSSQAEAVDLLFPGVGELCGGSLREDSFEILQARLKEHGLLESLQWYLDLRKFGNVPTGGFGMGYERLLKFILGTNSIKDTIPFPRWPHNCQL